MGRWHRPRLHHHVDHIDTDHIDVHTRNYDVDDDHILLLVLLVLLDLLDLNVVVQYLNLGGDLHHLYDRHVDDQLFQLHHLDLIRTDVHDFDQPYDDVPFRLVVDDLDHRPDYDVNVDHLDDGGRSRLSELHQVGHVGDAPRG